MHFFAFLLRFLLKVMRKDELKKNSIKVKRVCRNAFFRIFIKIFIISYTKIRKYQLKKISIKVKRVCKNAIFRIFIKIFIKSDAKRSTQKKFYRR